MRRWRTALISVAALAALLVPVQTAAAQGPKESPTRGLLSGPHFKLGHSKTKAPARAVAAADHAITLRGIDLDGQAVAPLASLIDLATGAEYPLTESAATLTGVVPAGDYSLTGIVLTGDPFAPRDLALYGNPTLTVAGDVDLTLDARTATEIQSVSPSATATEFHSHAQIIQTIAGQEISATVSGRPETSLRAWPSATTTRPYHFTYAEAKTEPANTRAYKLAFATTGRIPANLTFTATQSSLALVNTTYASQGLPSEGVGPNASLIDFDGIGGETLGLTIPASAPSTKQVYYTANGVRWKGSYFYNLDTVQVPENQTAFRAYTAGGTHSETFNKAAFGPTVSVGHGEGTIFVRPLVTDTGQQGNENLSGNTTRGTTGTVTLYRNGQLVGVSTNPLAGDFAVPPESATFQAVMSTQRNTGWSRYVKSIDARWTFTSAERPGDPFENQHRLLQPRITGAYDSSGRAPSGRTFPLTVAVERATGGSAVTSISLQASFNDGASWVTVPLTAGGTDRWTANVAHPFTHNGFVALRFNASDGSGNSVQQTVTRAYGLR
ncbi:hypothetical protein ETD83_15520 [Actinomadura soli]|uniref:Uncharacterized protein n=1 Tax=Actinomadura soli TaxID=2508997 RepID=A0A5C4JEE3_9ACTN|nr:hypothetical protein [Actinomadura soli]TMR01063.1 hypothetical protein ETD83_15520 [Actinomadura soli]